MLVFCPCHFRNKRNGKSILAPWKGGRILRVLRNAPFPQMIRLSREELAQRVGYATADTIKRIERERYIPREEDYSILLEATGINPSLHRQIMRTLNLLNVPQRSLEPAKILSPFKEWLKEAPWPSLVLDSFGDIVLLNEGVLWFHGLPDFSRLPQKMDFNVLWWLFSNDMGGLFSQIRGSSIEELEIAREMSYWFLRASIGYIDECYWWYRFEKLSGSTSSKDDRVSVFFIGGVGWAWQHMVPWGSFKPKITFRRPDGKEFEVWLDVALVETPYGDLYWVKYIPASRKQGAFMEVPQRVHTLAPWPLSRKKIPEGWQPRAKYLRYLPERCHDA